MHVATIRRRYKRKVYTTYLLRRSYREAGKVKHETLANLTALPESAREALRRALRGETLVNAQELFSVVESLPHGHVAAVLMTLRKIGLDKIIASQDSRRLRLVLGMIVARIVEPASKLATAQGWRQETPTDTLCELLGLQSASEDELYSAMDWLYKRQERIEKELARRHLSEGCLALYDATSTYFEGRCCPLAALGKNRDGKKDKLQIVLGLLCSSDGCPVAVEVFPGNTADPKTLPSQLQRVREQFALHSVVWVGDRGMITEARIRQDLKTQPGLDWITALRAPAIARLYREGPLDLSLFDERDLGEISDPHRYPGERLIVCRNPFLAQDRARTRQELIAATEQKLDRIVKATERARRPLRGTAQIGMKVGAVLNKHKVGKHFTVHITDMTLRYQRREDAIAQEALLDGIYILRTSLAAQQLSPEAVVDAYKGLSKAERAFRSLKTVDLKVRPIHHRLADRVRAHVFLCMLAYYVEWHMRQALAPLLFDDEEPLAAQALRSSPVHPARRSPAAIDKTLSKRSSDPQGRYPVQSFQTLLRILATIARNRIRFAASPNTEISKTTESSPLQRRAFELLGLSPSTCM